MEHAWIILIMLVVELVCLIILYILNNSAHKCYEKTVKFMKKQIDLRDRQIELQEFIINTQSKMIEKMRS